MADMDASLGRIKVRRERLEASAIDLESAVTRAAGDSDTWIAGVQAAATEVGAALQAHIDEVEKPGGLYEDVIGRSPRQIHTIDVLRREHVVMGEQVERLDGTLADRRSTVDDVRQQALALLAQISRHRHRGADLLWDSYDFDIGLGE